MKIRYLLLHAYGMGGTIRTVITQANAMAAAGHDVELVSVVRRRSKPSFELHPGVRLRALADQRAGIRPAALGGRVVRRLRGQVVPRGEPAAAYFTPEVERAVASWMRALSGGVLVTTRPALNLLAARYAPRRVVLVAQEHLNLSTHRQAVQRAIRNGYRRFDAVVVLTDTDRVEYGRALPGTRVVTIPNAVNSVPDEPVDHSGTTVIAAGRLVPQKGFDLLIPAFGQVTAVHPDWRLRIFGTGPLRDSLRELVTPEVSLMGRTESFDEELASAAMYVLSSRFEGLPMVLIEAMAHGLPVVAFDCPTGPGDVITHDVDGLLVPPGDADALAATVVELIEDEPRRRRLGAAAIQTVRSYTPEVIVPKWQELFEELLTARRGADQEQPE